MIGIIALLTVQLLATAWALWVRRGSWSSRWDAPLTASIALQTIGAVFDTPWPAWQIAVSRVFGGPHVGTVVANLCYLAAALLAVIAVYSRLLPDHWATAVINTRFLQPVFAAVTLMIVAFNLSSATASGSPLVHLYFIPRDGWLTLYWVIYCLTLQSLLVTFIIGIGKLDFRHYYGRLYRVGVIWAMAASALQLIGLTTRNYECLQTGSLSTSLRFDDAACVLVAACWSLGYMCTIVMSLAAGRSWQVRAKTATPPTTLPTHH